MEEILKRQLIDEGQSANIEIDDEIKEYFEMHFSDNSLVEWLAEEGDSIVATGAIVFIDFPPAFTNRRGVKGYITNMYTAPSHRGKGLAAVLLNKLVDEAKSRSVNIILLAASKMGKPVYKRFGFTEADEWMELILRTSD